MAAFKVHDPTHPVPTYQGVGCWRVTCLSFAAQQLNFIPPAILFPTISPPNPAHNGRVCSTWGDFHYKTFDGAVFRFPGLCNYVLSAHCGGAYEDFNVQLRRGMANSRPTITRVVLRSQGLVLEASNGSVLVDGQRVKLPFARAGLLVEKSSSYIKVSVRLVLTFMWNGGDSALLELDPKYINQTCGLCGDFNGLPAASEFYAHNARLTPLQFGNLQKMDGPTEQCQDPLPSAADNCTDEEDICRRTLLGAAFSPCHALVDPEAYVAACTQDLCRCPTCPCATFAEYSRQCAHAGGQPQNWRRPDLCPATCPLGMQHLECGSPCADTCSNPERAQLCEDHCVDGCFCPDGTVWDDVGQTGCVPLEQCSCTHGGRTYAPGASFTSSCSSCTCSGGRWQCQDLPCPGTCSVQGGAHVSTYDEKLYDLHGDCSYVLSKQCADSSFTVLAELRKCGLTDTENCLKAVTLSLDGGDTTIRIQSSGGVFMNSIYTQLPVSAANITIFKPTSFFIVLNTALGLQVQVQLVPLMQVFLQLLPEHRGQMCGLCGNFNQNQADDFRALSGVVEGTAAAFANTWKTQASCPNVRNSFEDPCSLSVENENYAQHWCSLLTHPASVFAACHGVINPTPFHSNCMFDTCNCEKSEDCMCAALSSYVRACAAKGVLLDGWRDGVCTKYMSNCPKSQRYAYMVDSCQPTCRALSQADVTCAVDFVPVDGCTCPPGTFLDDAGACVPAEACPCYFRGSVVAPGEVVHDNGIVCSCSNGKLSCLGASEQKSRGCVAPMVYLDCNNASAGTPGAECLRSCHTLDVDCFSTHCVSGCVCPLGLVSDGNGGCVAEEDCPCLHNDATYRPGDTIRVDCNTCTCKNRRWECSRQPCLGTCVAYGDGHFITFDGERYSFDGSCEYTLAQDHCGSSTTNGTFRVVTENVPCGTTGVTCSKAIKIFLESYELILHEGTHKVVQRGPGEELPYKIRLMGIYLVVETRHGLVVSWDRRTSVFIRLRQDYKGRVCGLCGNFDDKAINDFTTRGQSVVGNALEFGNSWKFSPSCPDAPVPRDPCTANPYRKSWAQKQCSLINSATFAACHPQVDPSKYYEACVSDACACDSGGDCECFCTAVAAYAQACRDVGVCVSWRSPDICPLFCDYYNPHGECEWHYEPCGAPCLKTCRNPSGRCLMDLPGLEGCYPKCPPSKPFFSEEAMSCVARCGCYDEQDNYYEIGTSIPPVENCQRCNCTAAGVQCTHSPEACTCTYEGRTYGYKEVIYNTTDGLGGCLLAVCGDNGTITRTAVDCPGTPATTPFTFTTTEAPIPTTGWAPTVSTVCVRQRCQWSSWYDSSRPLPGLGGGDFETFEGLRQKGYPVCAQPVEVECRAQQLPSLALAELGQTVECSLARGLVCLNSEQSPPLCHNYEVRVLCCDYVPCATSPAPATPRPIQSSTTPVPPPASQPTPTGATSTFRSTAASPSQAPSSGAPEATSCQPRCQWTEWFDTDYPQSEEAGGDMETYDRIRNAGGDVCAQPQDIECRAENFPDQTPEELGQRVHCDVNFGLECRNQEQPGLFKMCYNYRVRILCCSYSHCGLPTTTANAGTTTTVNATPTTKLPATEPGTMPGTTLGSTTAPSSLPAGATSLLPSLPSRTSSSTVGSPTSAPGTTTTSVPGQATSVHPSHTTTQKVMEASSQEPTPVLVTVQRFTTRPATGAQVGKTSTVPPGSPTPYLKETSTGGRETVPVTAEATTSTGTTGCQPRCEWTEWLDVDFPTSGVMGGDIETFENIRAAGGRLCEQPQKIECRAENYPEVSIDQIGQVLTCSLQTGLICRNRDQKGPFNMCFNYNIRVLCCDDYRHCPSTAQPAHTRTTTQPELSTTPTGDEQASKSTPGSQATTTWGASSRNDETASVVTPHRKTTSRSPGTRSPSTTTLPARLSKPSTTTPTQATSPSQGCEPQCAWTDWFDEDYPTPGPNGGDFETLAVLRAAGHIFCEQPEDIECRSELEPQVALEQLDQVVMCNVSVGLVCRNREQPQPLGYCHNYHVRLLCCDYSRCASSAATTATRATTPATTRTPVVPTTGATSPGQSLSPEASPGTTLPPPSTETGTAPNTAKVGLSTRSLPPSPTPKATDSPGSTSSGPSTSASTASGTPGLIQTTPLLTSAPPAASVTPGSGTTACQPRCSWSDWLNESNPVPGATGGDFETYASLRAAGHVLCEQPVALECRAAALPDVPLPELGQVVQCRLQDGLVCRNRDQVGRFKMCLDYQVRVLCCDYSHCPSTPATTAIAGPSTRPHSPLPTSTSTLSPMSPSTGPAGTTSGCQPACRWTDWLDSDQPLPGRYGGDIETYYHIESVHGQLCAEPVAIECEAVLFPGVELQQLGQVVQCDVHYGLICRNSWQVWGRNCLNYHVRVQCCDDYSHCTSSPAPTATTSGTSTGQPTSEGPHTGTPGTTQTRPSSPAATPSSTPTQATSPSQGCEPQCAWTDWFDEDYPTPGPNGGDFETLAVLRAAGHIFCEQPEDIECRSELKPQVALEQLDQVVMCNVSVGLVCRNREQPQPLGYCHNYHVRLLCCDYSRCASSAATTATRATTPATTRTPVVPTTGATSPGQSLSPEASPGTTLPPPSTETGTAPNTAKVGLSTRSLPPSPTPKATDSPGSTSSGPSTSASTASGTPGLIQTTPLLTSAPPAASVTPGSGTTACQPRCSWSDWLNESNPVPGATGGDFETYASLRAAGHVLCEQPVALECRAAALPDVPLPELGQVVQCDVHYGLICRNSWQVWGRNCLNYHVRVQCCDDYSHCTSSPAPTATTSGTSTDKSLLSRGHAKGHTKCHQINHRDRSLVFRGHTKCHQINHGDRSLFSRGHAKCHQINHGDRVTTSTTFSATETEASTPKATPWITMSNTEAGSSSPGPTTSATKSSTLTGPSSPRATPSITEFTTQTGASSPRTTERVSVPGPSPSSTIPSASTRPASSLTSTTSPVVTAHIKTTSRFPGTRRPSTSTLPSQPSSTTPPEATSPSQGCEPQCAWTDWFDEDYPTPGPNGGDFETLAVLRAAGHIFCEQPEDIECRSELKPQVALEQLDQVVMCNVSVGLVCRNREQPQPRPYCHNYHVRLLCCDYSRCASSAATTATRATTPATTRTPVVPTTGATSSGQPDMSLSTAHPTAFSLEPTTSPSSLAPTSHCFCQAFGQLFLPGDVVYNKTDRAGCRFYAICNQHCAIDRFQDDCPSPSPPTPSVSTPLPSPAPGCDLVDPPRQVNESWTLEDCTVARCEGHNHIVLLEPTPVAPVTCVNGLPPVKVGHEDEPCDYHYECECSCSGWGNSHYSTFDGTSYSFSDNCTYVLVREIRPQLRNLSVLLDNSFCEASPPAARCPRALRVRYQSTEVILSTTTSPSGQRESLILFDQMRVSQSFSKNGVQVSATVATAMSLVIPVIGISITFDGQAFQIQLPYGLFHHNTEGQCGTCTNSQADDCRRPDGTMAPSCRDMASSWLFPESNKEGCWAPPSPPPTASPSPAPTMSTSTPCPPAPLCELLLSEVFAECQDLIPPEPFLSACLSDGCQTSHPATPCQSLEAYAALCRGRGVCSDWRNATGGLCDLTCPPGKVYEPCGPAQPPTCDSRAQSPVSTALAEGCFCPDGQTLFNAYTDVCVPQCPCVGPDGYPKFPGERWVSNCQECECAGSPVSVRCTPLPCPVQDLPPECGLAGFVTVTRPRADNPCCSETLCVCNITTCPQNPPECGPQEELIPTQEGGNCCPTFTCRPKLCEYNGTVYGVGATFPAVTPCHTCTCLSTGTQEPTIHCEKETCMTTCPQGFHYTTIAGQCCGECLQSTCFTPDGGLIQPNETWANSLDNCTEYHCEAENGRFLLMLRPTACPDVSSCRGILRKSGCCYTCEEDVKGSCHVRTNMTVLQHGDCVTEVAVNVPFCEGSCPGMSRYSPDAQTMQHHCTCCRELRTHQRTVTLHCPDSTTIQHSYTYVDACDCEQACVPEAAPDRPQQLSSSWLAR
ncbi:mucin-5B-like [Sorex fumeus]|uniref:mucin-5B-like n=1 Tax=Sorex fumeus TaxID=62283 RepID=UPI0024AD9FF7|nr:mucin-5B-like [Sorex fumeus]